MIWPTRSGPASASTAQLSAWPSGRSHGAPEDASTARGSASRLGGSGGASHTLHTVQMHRPDSRSRSPAPRHQTRGAGTGGETRMPRGGSSRHPGAPPPAPGDGTAPSSKAHRCRSRGTAPRCRSCGGPGPEGPGQRALPRCKAVPSRRQGDRREDEPRGLSSWLAQEALERGVDVSPTTGDSGRRPTAGRRGAIFTWSCTSPHLPENPSTLAEKGPARPRDSHAPRPPRPLCQCPRLTPEVLPGPDVGYRDVRRGWERCCCYAFR